MVDTLSKSENQTAELVALRDQLREEQRRLARLQQEIEEVLRKNSDGAKAGADRDRETAPPRPGPLDRVKGVMHATADLRVSSGNLSAERVAKVFGVSLSQLAGWLGRTRQAVSKTPAADSLQPALNYFERVARLRLVTKNDAEFRKWLRMPNELLGGRTPLLCLKTGAWQEIADQVDDMLTGTPT